MTFDTMSTLVLLTSITAIFVFIGFCTLAEWTPRLARWLQARALARALYDLRTMELWAWWMRLKYNREWTDFRSWHSPLAGDYHRLMSLGVQRVPWVKAKCPLDLGCVYADKFVRDDVEHFYAGNMGGYQSWILDAMADDRHVGESQP